MGERAPYDVHAPAEVPPSDSAMPCGVCFGQGCAACAKQGTAAPLASLLDRVDEALPTVTGGRWIVAELEDGCGSAPAIAAAWLPDPERINHVRAVVGHAADRLHDARFYCEGRALASALWICDDSAAPPDRGTDMDAALARGLAASDALRPLRGEVVKVARPELDAWYDKHGHE